MKIARPNLSRPVSALAYLLLVSVWGLPSRGQPLPDTFTHISVHMVHVLARLRAKRLVQEQLRNEGVRLSLVPPREINERATAYLRDHVEVWKEAIARAHKLDEMEGQRKDRQRLRREQLA